MGPDDLLCSRNARLWKTLARANGTSQRASGGRVRETRAVGDQSSPIPERLRASLEGQFPLER